MTQVRVHKLQPKISYDPTQGYVLRYLLHKVCLIMEDDNRPPIQEILIDRFNFHRFNRD